MTFFVLSVTVVAVFGRFTAFTQASPSLNRMLNYQLRLTDAAGVPVADGTKNLKLTIYTASSGGTQLYTACSADGSATGTPTAVAVTFANGTGTTLIGSTGVTCASGTAVAIPADLFNADQAWLGVTVEADAEMTPRKRIVASAYSLNADRLDDLETSAAGGVNAYVPVTDSSGNLTLSANVTVDTDTLFVDSANNRVGFGSATPTHRLHVLGIAGEEQLVRFESADVDFTALSLTNTTQSSNASFFMTIGGSTGLSAFGLGAQAGIASLEVNSDNQGVIGNRRNAPLKFGTNDLVRMTIDASGNVGIGTSSPEEMLEIQKTMGVATEDAFIVLDSDNSAENSGTSIQFKNNNTTGAGYYSAIAGIDDGDKDGRIEFRVSNNAVANTTMLTSSDTVMTIDQTGFVGMGDTTPSFRLDAAGDAQIQGDDGWNGNGDLAIVRLGAGSDDNGIFAKFGGTGVGGIGIGVFSSGAAGDLGADSRTALWIDSESGNVGLNTTSPAQEGELRRDQDSATAFRVSNHNVDNGGNTTAHALFQVFDGTNEASLIMWPEAHVTPALADSAGLNTNRPGGMTFEVFGGSTGDFKWLNGANERMRLLDTGELGIGDTTPDALLDVAGSFQFDGNAVFGDAATDTLTLNAELISHILPDVDDTYDLGSNAQRWRDLYLGPASLHIGTATGDEGLITYNTTTNALAIDSTGAVEINGGSGSTGCSIDASGNFSCSGTVSGGGGSISGSGATGAVTFWTGTNTVSADATNFFWDDTANRLGIGTASPVGLLHVASDDVDVDGLLLAGHETSANALSFKFRKSRGTAALPANVVDGDNAGAFNAQAYSGGTYFDTASINFKIDGTFTSGQRPPSRVEFYTNAANSAQAERMRIDAAGNVGIGVTPLSKLHVSGTLARLPNGSVSAGSGPGIAFDSYPNDGLGSNGSNIAIWQAGVIALNLTNTLKEFRVPSDYYYSWSSATNNNSGSDTQFSRASAGVIQLGVGASFNALRLGAPTSGTLALGVRAASGQTANIQEWQNSSGTALAVVDASGDFGIGDTTPDFMLDVGAGTVQTNISIDGSGSTSYNGLILQTAGAEQWFFGRNGTGSNDDFIFRADATANPVRFVNAGAVTDTLVVSGGLVGIGATPSGSPLHIQKDLVDGTGIIKVEGTEPDVIFNQTGVDSWTTFTFRNDGVDKVLFGKNITDDLYFSRHDGVMWQDETMVIKRLTGNVGIGDGTPDALLDVAGSFQFDGDAVFGDATTDNIVFNADVNSSILPNTDDAFDLGSNAQRWRDLYLGPASLHIGSSLTDEGTITYDTTGNVLNFATDATTNGDIAFFTDKLFLDKSSGNVGIRNTNPQDDLDVTGAIRVSSGYKIGALSVLFDNGGTLQVNGAAAQPVALSQAGSSRLTVDASGHVVIASNLTVDTSTLFVDSANNRVGIGTASPQRQFHAQNGASGASIGAAAQFLIETSSSAQAIQFMGPASSAHYIDYGIAGSSSAAGFIRYNDAISGGFAIGTSSALSALTIGSTGLIGMGTAPSVGNELHVKASGSNSANFVLESGQGTLFNINTLDLNKVQVGTGSSVDMDFYTNSSTRMVVQADGDVAVDTNTLFVDAANNRVGIGTDTPGQLLDAVGGENSAIDLRTGGLTLRSQVNTVAGAGFGTVSSHKLYFYTGNSDRMTILADGNIGIGTSTPITQLHVPGKVPTAAAGSASTSTAPATVFIQDRYAYVANFNGATLQIFDVSNPASIPAAVGSIATGGSATSVFVQGRYAYVSVYGLSELRIYDVSIPTSPSLVGSVATGSLPNAVYVQGRYAYVVNGTGATMQVIDVANPAAPTVVGSVATGSIPIHLYVNGRYAYVTNFSSNTLQVIDVSTPTSPSSVSTVATGSGPQSVYVQGRYAYVTNYSAGTLQIFDVSNPASMTSVSSTAAGSGPYHVQVHDRYAYIAGYASNTLRVMDVSNPSSPSSVGTVTTGTNPQSVYVQGRYAFVVNAGSATMQSFDLGGTYLQQLEAGGIEAASLAVRNSFSAMDGAFRGGLTASGNAEIGGRLGVQGDASVMGNMGIGINEPVNAKLHIHSASGSYIHMTDNTSGTTGSDGLFLGVNGGSESFIQGMEALPFNLYVNSSTLALTALSSGNVGIGTSTPGATFAVGTGSTDKLQIAGSTGDMTFTDTTGQIIFPASTGNNGNGEIIMFNGCCDNGTRTILGHSPSFADWGLQYDDTNDDFEFVTGISATPDLAIDMGTAALYVGSSVSGTGAALHRHTTGILSGSQANGAQIDSIGLTGIVLEEAGSEGGGFFANGNTAAIWSPGDGTGAILSVYDEDVLSSGAGPWQAALRVQNGGTLSVQSLTSAGSTLCYNTSTFSGYNTLSNCVSSRKYKENIQPLEIDVDKVLQLQPVSFDWKTVHHEAVMKDGEVVIPAFDEQLSGPKIGLIAEDVAELFPEIIEYKDGEVNGLEYKLLSVYQLAVLKQHHADIAKSLKLDASGATYIAGPQAQATADVQASDSAGITLRGSAWDTDASAAVERDIAIRNVITDAGAYRLSVTNENGDEIAYLGQEGDVAIKGRLFPSDRGALQTDKYIYYDGSAGLGGDFMRTNASGWGTGSYDFAEMFPSDDALEAGELVMVDTRSSTKMRRAIGGREEAPAYLLAGIVSTRPGFLAGMNDAGSYPIALEGRVPTRVVGPVKIGDPITVSLTDGVGVVAVSPTYVVGYALEAKDSDGPGTVTVFVKTGWWNGAGIESSDAPVSGASAGDLTVTENTIDFGRRVALAVGAMEGIDGLWSIDGTGKLTAKEIVAEQVKTKELVIAADDAKSAVGEGVIPVGNSTVTVENPALRHDSRIFVTFYGNTEGAWWISRRVDGAFDITLGKLAPTDLRFEYWIMQVDDTRTQPPPAPVTEPAPVPDPTPEPAPETVTDSVPEAPPDASPAPETEPSAEPTEEPPTAPPTEPEPAP